MNEDIEIIDLEDKIEEKIIETSSKIKKNNKLIILFIILDLIAVTLLFLAYGPISYFRDLFITTAMTTMNHKYFAYTIYSEDTVNKVLNSNFVKELEENTNASEIIFEEIKPTDEYESIYEEQILKKDEGNDLYKLINIDEAGYKGYMVAIYDASRISLATSTKLNVGGQILDKIVEDNDAIIGINASGFYRSGKKMTPNGRVIQDGKLKSNGTGVRYGNGLVGFNKDHVLVLTKESASKAIENGMVDAVEFGPFLIVNGKAATIVGNGGYGIAPRTAIAQRKDGIVLFLVIDGRSASSLGAGMNDLIKIFTRYKAYNASNLDGGGSSTLIINDELINNPKSYGYSGERYIPNGWIVK